MVLVVNLDKLFVRDLLFFLGDTEFIPRDLLLLAPLSKRYLISYPRLSSMLRLLPMLHVLKMSLY